MPDDPRQDRAGAHIATGEADLVEQKRDLGTNSGEPHVGCHRDDRTRAGTDSLDRGYNRLRAGPHRLDEIAGHTGEGDQALGIHLHQRADDLEHIAAGGEIAASAGHHDHLDLIIGCACAEEIRELAIAFEGQRIFPLGTVERHGCYAVGHDQQEVVGRIICQWNGHGIGWTAHGISPRG